MSNTDGRPSSTHPAARAKWPGWFRKRERPSKDATGSAEPATEAEVDIVDQAEAFQSLRVRDVMTPRADIVALEISTPLDEVLRRFVDSELTRVPIYRETLDDPVGVVHKVQQQIESLAIELQRLITPAQSPSGTINFIAIES